MCGPYGWAMGGWTMILITVFWLLLIAGIVLAIVWAVNRTRIPTAGGGESALDILQKRYARGEINREEFERMKQELS